MNILLQTTCSILIEFVPNSNLSIDYSWGSSFCKWATTMLKHIWWTTLIASTARQTAKSFEHTCLQYRILSVSLSSLSLSPSLHPFNLEQGALFYHLETSELSVSKRAARNALKPPSSYYVESERSVRPGLLGNPELCSQMLHISKRICKAKKCCLVQKKTDIVTTPGPWKNSHNIRFLQE